jgi:hypothetical protein
MLLAWISNKILVKLSIMELHEDACTVASGNYHDLIKLMSNGSPTLPEFKFPL